MTSQEDLRAIKYNFCIMSGYAAARVAPREAQSIPNFYECQSLLRLSRRVGGGVPNVLLKLRLSFFILSNVA